MNKPDLIRSYRRLKKDRIELVFLDGLIPPTPSVVLISAYKARLVQHLAEGGTRRSFMRQETDNMLRHLNTKASLPTP